MEKKTYIKPEMEVAELSVSSMLAASAPSLGFGDSNITVDTENGDQLSIGRTRRGKWGNLWYVED